MFFLASILAVLLKNLCVYVESNTFSMLLVFSKTVVQSSFICGMACSLNGKDCVSLNADFHGISASALFLAILTYLFRFENFILGGLIL